MQSNLMLMPASVKYGKRVCNSPHSRSLCPREVELRETRDYTAPRYYTFVVYLKLPLLMARLQLSLSQNTSIAFSRQHSTLPTQGELLSPGKIVQGIVAYQIFKRDTWWWEKRLFGGHSQCSVASRSSKCCLSTVGCRTVSRTTCSSHQKCQSSAAVALSDELKVVADLAHTPQALLPMRGAEVDALDFAPHFPFCCATLSRVQEAYRSCMFHVPHASRTHHSSEPPPGLRPRLVRANSQLLHTKIFLFWVFFDQIRDDQILEFKQF